jgi:hypothetical protein
VLKFWLLPLFGHSIAWLPEAAVSFTTTKGAKVLWLERLSSSTTSEVEVPPLLLDEELELLVEDEPDELLVEPLQQGGVTVKTWVLWAPQALV